MSIGDGRGEAVIRPRTDDDLPALADLRWRWVEEQDGTPAVSYREFVAFFADWAREHAHSHHCTVVERDGVVVGQAWLALLPRVPSPRSPARASGDVQCVYLLPSERNDGLGSRLVAAVLADADRRGVERATVHSSPRAVPVYERAGFSSGSRLLDIALNEPSR